MTATPIESGDGIELCPPGMTGRCPGVVLAGELDPELLVGRDEYPPVIEIRGVYDGRQVVPTDDPQIKESYPPFGPSDFASLCPGLQGSAGPETHVEAINSYVHTVPEDFAGMWWDQESAVMTVWFVGDEIEVHHAAIAAAVPDQKVCVAGGARFSEAELMEAMDALNAFGTRITTSGYGINTLSNRIELSIQEVDTALRQEITEAVGERVMLFPYMDVMEVTLDELPPPIPVVPGNVELLTSRLRYGGGMDALGRFVLAYDADLNCIYFESNESGAGGRTVPVWPFGYSAINDPVEIYDYDGEFIAGQGTILELAGGFVEADFIDGNGCGAESAWIVNA